MPEITIDSPDGQFMAYRADPDGGSGPAIVVIQEIFGVNKVMRDICDWWAGQGYIAVCPDIFWRQEPGIQLTDQTEAEWGPGVRAVSGLRRSQGHRGYPGDHRRDPQRRRLERQGRHGSVFCLGGKLAYLCAARTDADANIGYYGVGIENNLDEAGNISTPTMFHIAEEDGFCPKEAQAQVHAALDGHARVTDP